MRMTLDRARLLPDFYRRTISTDRRR
jgi:hypothetical protein